MATTLVIIDVQYGFVAAEDPHLRKEIIDEVWAARDRRAGIVLVEYSGFGPTYNDILFNLKGYSLWEKIKKYEDDGGREVYDSVTAHNFDYRSIRLCGVNGNSCVVLTAETLCDMLPYSKVEIVIEACGSLDLVLA